MKKPTSDLGKIILRYLYDKIKIKYPTLKYKTKDFEKHPVIVDRICKTWQQTPNAEAILKGMVDCFMERDDAWILESKHSPGAFSYYVKTGLIFDDYPKFLNSNYVSRHHPKTLLSTADILDKIHQDKKGHQV